jgi:hypothetical protein
LIVRPVSRKGITIDDLGIGRAFRGIFALSISPLVMLHSVTSVIARCCQIRFDSFLIHGGMGTGVDLLQGLCVYWDGLLFHTCSDDSPLCVALITWFAQSGSPGDGHLASICFRHIRCTIASRGLHLPIVCRST